MAHDPGTCKAKRNAALTVGGVAPDKVRDAAFWYALFRLQVYPRDGHGPQRGMVRCALAGDRQINGRPAGRRLAEETVCFGSYARSVAMWCKLAM